METISGVRTVIITGASSGIGRALAIQTAQAGYAVLAVARRGDLLKTLEREIAAGGGLCATLAADIRGRDTPARIVSAALARFGRIDTVINAAGVAARGELALQSDNANHEQFETHVIGPLALIRQALPHLRIARGHVILVGSGVARLPIGGLGAYPVAKAAVRAAAAILRRELRPDGIALTYVDPGAVATGFMTSAGMAGPPEQVLLAPQFVAARILKSFARRPAVLNASPLQSAMVALGALFPGITAALMERMPELVGAQPAAAVTAAPIAPAAAAAPADSPVDAALEPLRVRMEKFGMRRAAVDEVLGAHAPVSAGEFAMRWAGMPNKHERALSVEVLTALERAGFLESAGEDTWKVVDRT